jgi:uncharacterized protein YeaC (DUF1315 family)
LDFKQLLESVNADTYESLKRSVELGKWPDGKKLSREQRSLCLQAVIAWENNHLPEDQRSGYIPPKKHEHCGGEGDVSEPQEQTLTWK